MCPTPAATRTHTSDHPQFSAEHTSTMGKGGSVAADARVEVISNAIRVIPDFPKVRRLGRGCCPPCRGRPLLSQPPLGAGVAPPSHSCLGDV